MKVHGVSNVVWGNANASMRNECPKYQHSSQTGEQGYFESCISFQNQRFQYVCKTYCSGRIFQTVINHHPLKSTFSYRYVYSDMLYKPSNNTQRVTVHQVQIKINLGIYISEHEVQRSKFIIIGLFMDLHFKVKIRVV